MAALAGGKMDLGTIRAWGSCRRLARLVPARAGNVAMTTGLIVSVLAGAVGLAVDYSAWSAQRSALQAAADAAVIAAAREIGGANATEATLQAIAEQVVRENLAGTVGGTEAAVVATLASDGAGLGLTATQTGVRFFSGLLLKTPPVIAVETQASVAGEKICVIGLDGAGEGTISLDSNARLTANGCAVHSNARHASGIVSLSNAVVRASSICSAGGWKGGSRNFAPMPLTDCPPILDPLAAREPPAAGPCTSVNYKRESGTVTLNPGTYCGGIWLDSNAIVKLNPGVYILKDGPLLVDSNAQISGAYVSFVFSGSNARFRFASNAKVDVGAPKSGPLAGILFFGDRAGESGRLYEIHSNYARNLLGTIYLPTGIFLVDADNSVADQSAYTAIVVRRMELYAGPNLVVNSNYADTDVPVPRGLGPMGAARLVN